MGIGKRIRELRSAESVASFSRKLGIHRNTLPRYESEERKPDSDFLGALCREYKVSPTWLLLGEGPKDLHQDDVEPIQPGEPTEPCQCKGMLSRDGHIFEKEPPFEPGLLSFIYKELSKEKEKRNVSLSTSTDADIIFLTFSFCQPFNKDEAEIICSIVQKWYSMSQSEREKFSL